MLDKDFIGYAAIAYVENVKRGTESISIDQRSDPIL